MLTIFCTAKPFKGPIGVIQLNALNSWACLQPRPEVLLFGDDEGSELISDQLQIRHIPVVKKSAAGLPLLSDMFEMAQSLATNNLVCYLDADIILTNDFIPAIRQVAQFRKPNMLVGASWTVQQETPIDFTVDGWQEELRKRSVPPTRNNRGIWGVDYFVFPKGSLPNFPPFAVGRPGWDNWLLYHVRSRGMALINGTPLITAIHQDHYFEYGTAGPKGQLLLWEGEDGRNNLDIVGSTNRLFSIADATHVLRPKGTMRRYDFVHLWRRLYTLPTLHPKLSFLKFPIQIALTVTRPLRSLIGLTMNGLTRHDRTLQ